MALFLSAQNSVRLTLLLSAVLLLSPVHAKAEELDSASQDALEKTQNLLNNQAARKEAASRNPDTVRANGAVEKLGGSQANTDAMYGLSSDIFAEDGQRQQWRFGSDAKGS